MRGAAVRRGLPRAWPGTLAPVSSPRVVATSKPVPDPKMGGELRMVTRPVFGLFLRCATIGSTCVYLPLEISHGGVSALPEMPGVPKDAAGPGAANVRLRELPPERDAEIAVLRGQVTELAELRAQAAALQAEAAGLQAQVADFAARMGMKSKTHRSRRGRTGWRSRRRSRCAVSPAGGRANRRAGRARQTLLMRRVHDQNFVSH